MPWPSNGQSWSCATTSLAGSSPWSLTTHPFSGWLALRTPMPGWPDGSSRSRTSTSLCVIRLEPRTPTLMVSLGSGKLSQVCQGSLPTHPLNFPYCLMIPTVPGRRLGEGGGGECDECPEASSASPWKQARNTCPSSSQADRSQLQLITRRLHKPRKPCTRERDFSMRPSINSPSPFSHRQQRVTDQPHWSTAQTHCTGKEGREHPQHRSTHVDFSPFLHFPPLK